MVARMPKMPSATQKPWMAWSRMTGSLALVASNATCNDV